MTFLTDMTSAQVVFLAATLAFLVLVLILVFFLARSGFRAVGRTPEDFARDMGKYGVAISLPFGNVRHGVCHGDDSDDSYDDWLKQSRQDDDLANRMAVDPAYSFLACNIHHEDSVGSSLDNDFSMDWPESDFPDND